MKILSIRQPWAWAILNCGKDIENRSWPTKIRGEIFVHASKIYDVDGEDYLESMGFHVPDVPGSAMIPLGGICGSVEIVDCVTESDSHWFYGPYGFVLRNPKRLPFFPCKGQLGFFGGKE